MTQQSNETEILFVRNLTQFTPRVYAFIRSLLPERADADEVLQETNLTLLRKMKEGEAPVNFLAWACAVARIEVLRFRDRQKPGKLRFGDEFVQMIAVVLSEKADLLEDRREALAGCLEKLTQRDRDLIRQRYFAAKTT